MFKNFAPMLAATIVKTIIIAIRRRKSVNALERTIFFNNGVPVSLMELRDVLVAGNLDGITLSEGSSHNGEEVTLVSLLGYLSKNMMFFRKAIHSDENSEIIDDNVICLAPKDLLNADMHGARMTCNIREFYPEI